MKGLDMQVLAIGGAASVGAGMFNAISVPFIGVPLTVIGMAALGAYLSTAYGKTEPVKKKLYFLVAANIFLACVAVAVIPRWLGWEWYDSKIEAPLAGFFAFAARFWVPPLIELLPELIKKFFKLGDYKKE